MRDDPGVGGMEFNATLLRKTRMSIAEIASSMRSRVPWRVAQRIFSSIGIHPAQGWEKTLSKLTDESDDLSEFEDELAASLIEHYICGEKLFRFYELSRDDFRALKASLFEFKIKKTSFTTKFPLLVDGSELGSSFKPQLLKVIEFNEGTAAIFGSVRVVSVREEVNRSDLSSSTADELGEYDELVGIRHVKTQSMDVVWLPSDSRVVEVRVDFPRGMHQDAGEATHSAIGLQLASIIGKDLLAIPYNLYPLIKKIYDSSDEGTVVELAFGTTTASLKHEKMRRQSADLREEVYHKAGKRALRSEIEPHRLSVVWKRRIETERFSMPELTLHTSARNVGAGGPIITTAELRNCMGVDDYEFVRGRLLHHLAT